MKSFSSQDATEPARHRAAAEPDALQREASAPDATARALAASPRVAIQRQALQRWGLPAPSAAEPVQRQALDEEALPLRAQGLLPRQLRAGMESLSGLDLSDVRVHRNSSQPAQLNALAYAQGSDIHLAPGQDQHLPHEAWHVVQQRQGRVQPTMQMAGVGINDDSALEREADAMGSQAAQMKVRGDSPA